MYRTECRTCKSSGREAQYIGESARTAFERGREHERDARGGKEISHIHNHLQEEHGEEEREEGEHGFSMKVVRGHRTALARQIHEAVLIANSKNLLNSKSEYNRCIIPRIAIMVGSKEKDEGEEKMIGEREAEELEEGVGNKKREANDAHQPRAKRRKRWNGWKKDWKRETNREKVQKRTAVEQLEGEESCRKRRRLLSLIEPWDRGDVFKEKEIQQKGPIVGEKRKTTVRYTIREENIGGGENVEEKQGMRGRRKVPPERTKKNTPAKLPSRTKCQNLVEMFEKIRKKEKSKEGRNNKPESPEKAEDDKLRLNQGVAVQKKDQGVAKHEKLQKSALTQTFKPGKSANSVKNNSKIGNNLKNAKSTPKVGKKADQEKKERNFNDIRKFFEQKVRQSQPRSSAPVGNCTQHSPSLLVTRNVCQSVRGGLRTPGKLIKYMANKPSCSSSTHNQESYETGLVGGLRKPVVIILEKTQPTSQPPSLEISDQ